jgi:hypothetical protein
MKRVRLAVKKTMGLLVLVVAALVGCSTITTTVDYDKSEDFSKYRTYGWVGTGNLRNDLVEKRIVAAVDQQLAAKGLKKGENPDLLVAVHGRLSKETQITAYNTGWGYGYRRGGMGMSTATVKDVPVGTLILDLVDGKDKDLVFRGTATSTIDGSASPDDREKKIQEAVQKILENYPPKKK